jgi:epoxyqueuosine reductase QueG
VSLKDRIKDYAFKLGADLVGFGGIGRCRHAPPMMSPQGLMPTARTVIVMALHHPDACVELGGERHPQEIGPYSVQYLMNSRLDEMSWRMGTFIERLGFGVVPVVSSNIWRYNEYKDLNAVFAPDVSHIYMAVVAGLAEIGYNGLALTPEYGARNRFVTVVTDAEIEPDPLIPPGTVCDQCMLCRKYCPAEALSKEVDGEKVVRIDPYEYRFPNKNLWRCSWGEHFDLDLDLDIPDKVTEGVILEQVAEHGVRSGEMGQCLKFCLPKGLRSFEPSYAKAPVRKLPPAIDPAAHRALADRPLSRLIPKGADQVIVSSAVTLRKAGLDLDRILPGARSAVTLLVTSPANDPGAPFAFGAQYQIDSLCYDLARDLEALGHRSLLTINRSASHPDPVRDENVTGSILATLPDLAGRTVYANTVVTRMPIAPQRRGENAMPARLDAGDPTTDLTKTLADLARALGADLAGVAPAARIEGICEQIRPVFETDEILDARDRSIRFTPWEPEITVRRRTVTTPADHLPGARSVLVFALRLHAEVVHNATRPPAEAVGPYAFQTYVTNWLGCVIGYRLVKHLEAHGYRAALTTDLTGTASQAASVRGPQPDLFSNRFAGLAAGLGWLTTSGHLATRQFGIRQRLVAVVTDAPLTPSPLVSPSTRENLCAGCDAPCIGTCPTRAITGDPVELRVEDCTYGFNRIDSRRCDWSKRYALAAESGFRYLGSTVDVRAPESPTPEALADALRRHDPIKKYRPVVAEPCVINCPLARLAGEKAP